MLANANNVRRAAMFLRALAGSVSWTADVFVDARSVAREKGFVGTDKELDEVEGYLLDQGWIRVDEETDRGASWYALTRHGLDESLRKLPAEPKEYKPAERAD
jgi:hypothetical protein